MTQGKPNLLFFALGSLLTLLRKPVNSEDGSRRTHLRNQAVALTAFASVFARSVSLLTALVSVPLTLHYLGNERFGLWMTISAFSALLSFTDFGVGNSVLTALAKKAGTGKILELRVQISSAYGAMFAIAIAMLALLLLVYPLVEWSDLFNVRSRLARDEAGPAVATFLTILALNIPLGLIARVQLGLQQGFRGYLWQGIASVFALAALVAATWLEASLPLLVLAMAGTPLAVNLANAVLYFGWVRPDLRPSAAFLSGSAMRSLSVNGGMFLVLQVCAALMFHSNALIIAQVLGAQAVATYSVVERMFAIIGLLLSFILTPLWPAYGEAVTSGDLAWVRRALRGSLLLSMGASSIMSGALVLFGPQLLNWWIGSAITVPLILLAGFGGWKVVEASANSMATFLNGVGALKIQVILALLSTFVSIIIKIWWIREFGIAGLLFAMSVTYLIFMLPFLFFSCRKALAKIEARSIQSGG